MDYSIYLDDFRHRIYASCASIGTLCMLHHTSNRHRRGGDGTIYKVIEKLRHNHYDILILQPVFGRNKEEKIISGSRFIFIKR